MYTGIRKWSGAEAVHVKPLVYGTLLRRHVAKKREGRLAFPVSRRVDETRGKKLEIEPEAELHLPGVVTL